MNEKEKSQVRKNLQDLEKGLTNPGFPCNSIPFAKGIADGVKLNGTDWIKSDQAKRILFVLIAQAYGQFFGLDSYNEYKRLRRYK